MEELIIALLANPAVRTFVEELVVKVVAELFHKRSTDPVFLAKSNQAFAQWGSAQTEQERMDAAKNLSTLLSS